MQEKFIHSLSLLLLKQTLLLSYCLERCFCQVCCTGMLSDWAAFPWERWSVSPHGFTAGNKKSPQAVTQPFVIFLLASETPKPIKQYPRATRANCFMGAWFLWLLRKLSLNPLSSIYWLPKRLCQSNSIQEPHVQIVLWARGFFDFFVSCHSVFGHLNCGIRGSKDA